MQIKERRGCMNKKINSNAKKNMDNNGNTDTKKTIADSKKNNAESEIAKELSVNSVLWSLAFEAYCKGEKKKA